MSDAQPWTVELESGTPVLLRAVQPDDVDALALGYEQLSTHSAYARFHTLLSTLSPAQLDYFTHVDHHDHEAVGALEPDTGEGLGIARYVRNGEDPTHAEVAVTIVDHWQGHGLGLVLLNAVADRAREENITCFTAEILTENRPMLALMRRAGPVFLDVDGTTTTAHLEL